MSEDLRILDETEVCRGHMHGTYLEAVPQWSEFAKFVQKLTGLFNKWNIIPYIIKSIFSWEQTEKLVHSWVIFYLSAFKFLLVFKTKMNNSYWTIFCWFRPWWYSRNSSPTALSSITHTKPTDQRPPRLEAVLPGLMRALRPQWTNQLSNVPILQNNLMIYRISTNSFRGNYSFLNL